MQAHSEWLEDYWSFWGGSERGIPFAAFNHYRDLDSDGRFTEGAACDLNADGDVGDVVFEGAVSHTCWGVVDEDAGSPAVADAEQGENVGGPTIEFDVNYDGLLDAPLLEWQVESLDWDGDRVPNWEDLFYTRPGDRSIQSPRERDGEIEAYRYGDDFAERLLLADPFRETDWSCPGVNISLEYCI